MKKLSEMTDEERYGKVGAEIRRLDPEAYKNRPKSMEGNLKLLKELRSRKTEEVKSAPRGPSQRYATGPAAKDKRAQEDFLSRNPQYRNREPGLKAVDEEMFSPGAKLAGAGVAGGAAAYGVKKLLDRFRNKSMERAGKELAEKGVPSADDLAKARTLAKERRAVSKRERDLDERLSSDMAGGYKRGGAVKSSASSRADGIAKRGKTRGKMV